MFHPIEKSSFEGFILDLIKVSLGVKFEILYVGSGFGIFLLSYSGAYDFSLDCFLREVCSTLLAELKVF